MLKEVKIKWVDACRYAGWLSREEAIRVVKPKEIISYGIIVHEEETHLVLASSVCDDGETSHMEGIPLSWIVSITPLTATECNCNSEGEG